MLAREVVVGDTFDTGSGYLKCREGERSGGAGGDWRVVGMGDNEEGEGNGTDKHRHRKALKGS